MKAMILAAGLGTRLRPLTNQRPKALVELDGRTLLEITLRRLASFGVREVIVNVHHFADQVIDYLKANGNFHMRIEVSREDMLLETGGGLKKAAWFFLEDSEKSNEPFLLHNVDVISTIELDRMLLFHRQNHALATLAVQERETSRYLLFDEHHRLCGRKRKDDPEPEIVRYASKAKPLAFSGVHVISPRLLPLMTEEGRFSIMDFYLLLAGEGKPIFAFDADRSYWRDLGKPESLDQAAEDIRHGILQL